MPEKKRAHTALLHRLDPRIKILSVVILSTVIMMVAQIISLAFFSGWIFLLLLISGLKLRQFLKAAKTITGIYGIVLAMYLFFAPQLLGAGLLSLWKFSLLIFLGILLTHTTTVRMLVRGFETLFSFIRFFKIPVHDIAFMLSLTIRFVPLFFMYGRRVTDAQRARLASYKKLGHLQLFIIKLFERLISCALTLTDTLRARRYTQTPTSAVVLRLAARDYIAGMAVLAVGIIGIFAGRV